MLFVDNKKQLIENTYKFQSHDCCVPMQYYKTKNQKCAVQR